MRSEKQVVLQQFVEREQGLVHPTYDSELEFYQLVQSGDVETIKNRIRNHAFWDINHPKRGTLSEDIIRNLKYHIIVTVAMITRFCIEGGMEEKVSYGLSDFYIKQIDETNDETGLRKLHIDMVMDYTMRMSRIHKPKIFSVHCIKAMDYVSEHMHEMMTVEEIAAALSLDRSYLGKLFKKETGETLSNYIQKQKIQTAKNMLRYSDYSCSEIASYLGYASQSHFSMQFKKWTGETPGTFRKLRYRKFWS